MKIRKLTCIILSALTALAAVSCSAPKESSSSASESSGLSSAASRSSTEENTVTVTDLVGRNVEVLPGSYKSIVCIGAGALRMYSYIGDTALLCGVEDIDNPALSERPKMFDGTARPYLIAYEDVFSALPSCGTGGPNAQSAEAEKILSCDPDIVISEYEDAEKSDALSEQLGVPVITLRSGPEGVFGEDFLTTLRLLGTVFAKNDRSEALISYIEAEKAELADRTKDIPEAEKPNVYICGLGNWGTTDYLMTAGAYAPFAAANIKNAAEGIGTGKMEKLEAEKFTALSENIDIMVIDAAAVKNITPLYAEDPSLFDACRAWNDKEVYLQMSYNAYYTNYEIALANAWYCAKVVYPDRFSDIDMTEKTDEITSAFLGKALAEEIFAYPASFGGYGKIDTDTFFKQ